MDSANNIGKANFARQAEVEAALKRHDENEGNGDGLYTSEEFTQFFVNQSKGWGENTEALSKLVSSQSSLFAKYAGEDNVFSAEEYDNLLQSKEYTEFIQEYRYLTGMPELGKAPETNELEKVKSRTKSPYGLARTKYSSEITSTYSVILYILPKSSSNKAVKNATKQILNASNMAFKNASTGVSNAMLKCIKVSENPNATEKQIQEAYDEAEKEIAKIQKNALLKLEMLLATTSALNSVYALCARAGDELPINEAIDSVMEIASGGTKKTPLKETELNEKEVKESVEKKLKEYEEQMKVQEEILDNENITDEEKRSAEIKFDFAEMLYDAYEKIEKTLESIA